MSNWNNVLVQKDILVISKHIGAALGISKAIVLGRVGWWCDVNSNSQSNKRDTHFHQGKWWMYQKGRDFQEDVLVISQRTIELNIRELENLKLLWSTADFNTWGADRTKWYTVNNEAFSAFMNLWQESGRPIRNGGTRQTTEYSNFIKDWEGNYAPNFPTYAELVSAQIAVKVEEKEESEDSLSQPHSANDATSNMQLMDEESANDEDSHSANDVGAITSSYAVGTTINMGKNSSKDSSDEKSEKPSASLRLTESDTNAKSEVQKAKSTSEKKQKSKMPYDLSRVPSGHAKGTPASNDHIEVPDEQPALVKLILFYIGTGKSTLPKARMKKLNQELPMISQGKGKTPIEKYDMDSDYAKFVVEKLDHYREEQDADGKHWTPTILRKCVNLIYNTKYEKYGFDDWRIAAFGAGEIEREEIFEDASQYFPEGFEVD